MWWLGAGVSGILFDFIRMYSQCDGMAFRDESLEGGTLFLFLYCWNRLCVMVGRQWMAFGSSASIVVLQTVVQDA